MRGPSNHRILSAFLFAIVLMAGLYFAVWYNAMKRTEAGLIESLHNILGGDISYDYAVWDYDLTKIGISVKNTASHFVDRKNNITYIHNLGTLNVSSDLFQNFHILIEFPQYHSIEITKEQKIIQKYQIEMDNASLSFYPNIEGGELSFSLNAINITNKNNKIFSATDLFFVKSGGGRTVHPNYWKLSSNKLTWNLPIYDSPLTLYSLFFEAKLKNFSAITMKDLYSVLLETDINKYNDYTHNFFKELYKRGSIIKISELRIIKDKNKWTAVSGDIKFNDDIQPLGLLSINTNQTVDVIDWLVNKNLVDNDFLKHNRNLKKIFKNGELLSVNLFLKKNQTTINGLNSGVNLPITKIINKHSNVHNNTEK